ncbi:MAG: hypothetical protein H6838_09660 [Planctomycetes bacterium]|nr:hypothetical protein [Planctomycetota bacterium]
MRTLLVAIVAVIACACLWRAGPRGLVGIAATALLSLLGVGTIVATFWVQPVAQAAPAHRPLVKPADDYVGSSTCRSCHPAEHASWHDSFHRTMTQVANRDTVLARFDRLERQGRVTLRDLVTIIVGDVAFTHRRVERRG